MFTWISRCRCSIWWTVCIFSHKPSVGLQVIMWIVRSPVILFVVKWGTFLVSTNSWNLSFPIDWWIELLTSTLDLPSLVYRRYHGDMTEVPVYKFTHGIYSSGYSLLPRAPQSSRRGHNYKLMKRRCHSQLQVYFFFFRVVNLWNRLPSDVVSVPSVNAFKSR